MRWPSTTRNGPLSTPISGALFHSHCSYTDGNCGSAVRFRPSADHFGIRIGLIRFPCSAVGFWRLGRLDSRDLDGAVRLTTGCNEWRPLAAVPGQEPHRYLM